MNQLYRSHNIHNIFTLTAKDLNTLRELALANATSLKHKLEIPLADVCFQAKMPPSPLEYRLAVVPESTVQMHDQLVSFASQSETTGLVSGQARPQPPKIAFLFTGQGSQYHDMGRQLYETHPVFRAEIDLCAELLASELDYSLLEVLYSPSLISNAQETELINLTRYTQPALFAIEYALAKLWQSWGIQPDVVMGHSIGEYVAACIAGVFNLQDGLKLVAARGRLMQALPQDGAMIAVMATVDRLAVILQPYGEQVAIAAINSPQNVVISGRNAAILEITAILESKKIKVTPLAVSHAFHSPLMEPMIAEFAQVAAKVRYSSPEIPVVSNVSGTLVTEELTSAEHWCDHVCQPVQFAAGIKTLYQHGYELFLEVGPHSILLGMGQQCLPENVGVWLPSLRKGQVDWQQMLLSLGELYVQGVKVDWERFWKDYPQEQGGLVELLVKEKTAKVEDSGQSQWLQELASLPEAEQLTVLRQTLQQIVGEVLSGSHSTGSGTNLQQHIPEDMLNRPFQVVDEWFKYFGVELEEKISKLEKEETVLDLCCGYGIAANTLARKFSHLKIIGVDLHPDETQVRKYLSLEPKKSLPAELIAHDACDMSSISKNSVSLCYCMAGIAYVPDGLRMLQETYRILKPGGKAFFYIMRRDDDIASDISLSEIAQSSQGGILTIHPFLDKTREDWESGIIPRPYYEDGVTLEIIKDAPELTFPFKFEGSSASLNSPQSRSMEAYYVAGRYSRLPFVS